MSIPDLPPELRPWQDKLCTAADAVGRIGAGQRVFIGTACAAPKQLVAALESSPNPPEDIELVHFITTDALPRDAAGVPRSRYRHRSFFVDSDMREAVRSGAAEYVPISATHLPRLIAMGRVRVDVALIQVSLPDTQGRVSLGISVDVTRAAVTRARHVIAEVNPHMPRSHGDTLLNVDDIDQLVYVDAPITEYQHAPVEHDAVERIARYIAGIIDDGSTLHIGLGRIPNQALKYLDNRRDLGLHTDVITDAIIPLLDKGILTGRYKAHLPGKVACSFALGSRRLYDLIDRNPLFEFLPIDAIGQVQTIASQTQMVSVTQAFSIDLTGQVCIDQFAGEFYSGMAAQAEFIRGAAQSHGGKPIICLMSTTDDGQVSRIRPALPTGEGVGIARTDVYYVITEYGIAYLFGKSIRERAIALIGIAHPSFRAGLIEQAQKLGYIGDDFNWNSLNAYPVEEERHITLRDGRHVLLRPATAVNAEGVRNLFYQLPEEDVYTRFFRRVRALSRSEVQRLCNLDSENEMAFVAVSGPREGGQIVGHASYFVQPDRRLAEESFMIHPAWQGSGLGSALQQRMMEHARSHGLKGFVVEVLPENQKMLKLARRCSRNISIEKDRDAVHMTMWFDPPV